MRTFLTFILAFFTMLPAQAQQGRFSTFIADSLDSYIQSGMSAWDIPGLSIGVVKDGTVVFSMGYGVRSIDEKQPVTPNTVFMIGSLTKAITCATTVLACMDNMLSLNDPVQKWIPDFRLSTDLASQQLILEDILTGRTGLGSHQGDFLFWKTHHTKEHLFKVLPELQLESNIRRKFIYNNLSYLVLDEILKRSTGLSWAEAVEEYFFNPLKMESSFALSVNIPQNTNLASSHLKEDGKQIRIATENIDNMGPAGSISSTAPDMCRWMTAFIDIGTIDSSTVFPDQAIRTLRKPYQLRGYRTRKDNPDQLRFFFSGMGWSIHDEFDQLTYFHDGGTDGFKSYMMVIPESRFGIVILTNSRSHNFAQAIADELQYAVHNQPFQNFNAEYLSDYREAEQEELKKQAALEKEISKSQPLNAGQYKGVYSNPLYGKIQIEGSKSGTRLHLLSHQNNLVGTLHAVDENSFWCVFNKPEFAALKITFNTEGDVPLTFELSAESSGDGSYIFTKEKGER